MPYNVFFGEAKKHRTMAEILQLYFRRSKVGKYTNDSTFLAKRKLVDLFPYSIHGMNGLFSNP